MQCHDVALRQQLMQARGRLGITVAKLVGVIVEHHPHAERFGKRVFDEGAINLPDGIKICYNL